MIKILKIEVNDESWVSNSETSINEEVFCPVGVLLIGHRLYMFIFEIINQILSHWSEVFYVILTSMESLLQGISDKQSTKLIPKK